VTSTSTTRARGAVPLLVEPAAPLLAVPGKLAAVPAGFVLNMM
jgi:hypothetical protein